MNDKPPWKDSDGNDMLAPADAAYKPATTERPGDKFHTVHGYILRETDKAILIEVWQVNSTPTETPDHQTQRNQWFPLSQVSTIHRDNSPIEDENAAYDYIRVKEWLLKNKGLI